VDIFEF